MGEFIWEDKTPRISWKLLQDNKSRTGVALPNLELYYDTANLVRVKEWVQLIDRRTLNLEGYNLNNGWHAALIYTIHFKDFKKHSLRRTLLKTWGKYKRKFIQKFLSGLHL